MFFGLGRRPHRGHFSQATVVFQGGRKWLQQQFHNFRVLAVERCIIRRRHDQDAAKATGVGQRSDQNVAADTGGHKSLQGGVCPTGYPTVGNLSPPAPLRNFLDFGRRAFGSSVGEQVVGGRETYRHCLHA